MESITVRSSASRYLVVFGRGALARLRPMLRRLPDCTGFFIITSRRVWSKCGARITRAMPKLHAGHIVFMDDAERAKNLDAVEGICRDLLRAGADRGSVIVAAGGGVVGDVAGYAAASYLRGVRLAHVPTTLMAQIDSSIGGKTGVNLPEGKNLIGAFYSPNLVVADPELLRTLPQRQYRSALYEVIKYGVIGDIDLFEFLENNMKLVLSRDAKAVDWIMRRCVSAKARIVTKDEKESGLRQILNFGHTLGHALEAETKYRRFLHGEAVGWGMIAATSAAMAAGRINLHQSMRIADLITSVGPLPSLDGINVARLMQMMQNDKKARAGGIRWVLPRRVGEVEFAVKLNANLALAAIFKAPAFVVEHGATN
jgi:3-dehydroquinate synthase